MSARLRPDVKNVLAAPLALDRPTDSLGRALWLYVLLVSRASGQGQVCRTLEKLARDLAVAPQVIEHWLDRLATAGLVHVTTPPPFLVVKIASWSSSEAHEQQESAAKPSESSHSHREVPVSSKQAAAALQEDGGSGEGEPLVDEILHVVGTADRAEIRALIAQYPRLAVLRALVRVRTTPASAIRKSKLALFRYLLTTFTRESHDSPHTSHPA